jgi:hypothetical protein
MVNDLAKERENKHNEWLSFREIGCTIYLDCMQVLIAWYRDVVTNLEQGEVLDCKFSRCNWLGICKY